MGRWLAKIQKSPMCATDKTDLSESVRKVSDTNGAFAETASTTAVMHESPPYRKLTKLTYLNLSEMSVTQLGRLRKNRGEAPLKWMPCWPHCER